MSAGIGTRLDIEREWLARVQNTLERIRVLKSTDRLSSVSSLAQCTKAVADSMQGWTYWLTAVQVMDSFDDETLRGFFEKLKSITIEVLELDIESTRIGVEKMKA